MNVAVQDAIECMWDRYSDSLTLTDLARSAILSKFHFCRIFSDSTGVSPGRFLAAVRIFQAKRLLLSTSMNVTDISFAVGYNSLGSFTNHFTASVGLPPGKFRKAALSGGCEFPFPRPASGSASSSRTISGMVTLPSGHARAGVYVGVFESPIAQGRPVAAAAFAVAAPSRSHTFTLTGVPAGQRYVHAVAIADSVDPEPWTRRVRLAGRSKLQPEASGGVPFVTIALGVQQPTDVPVLVALPNLESLLGQAGASARAIYQRAIAHRPDYDQRAN